MRSWLLGSVLVWTALVGPQTAAAALRDTVHNLSATGPGPARMQETTQLCVFCHTPHGASARGLWNRDLPTITYQLYESSTLEAGLKQPTGASRLCLSCHDGTTALGNLRRQPRAGPVTSESKRLTGRTVVGIDLSDDHPVSFVYDENLAAKRRALANPTSGLGLIMLDQSGQLQCTACHDPHDNPFRQFLRMDDKAGALCVRCHVEKEWADSAHAVSAATWNGDGTNPWPRTPYSNVADNGCENCHRPHAAPRGPRLLSRASEPDVCLVCHNGNVASPNLEAEFAKPSRHPIDAADWTHDPVEDPDSMPRHVTCVDCHNPHQTAAGSTGRPAVSASLRGVVGVDLNANTVRPATADYQVCLRCHGLRDQTTVPAILRQNAGRNIRLKIDPSNRSHHAVAAAGRNATIRGFEPGYSRGSVITCTDCHTNDEKAPAGPHGSRYAPILERRYDTNDPTSESRQVYALCYKCHNRELLLDGRAGAFPHRLHVVEQEAPCAVCHDAHGVPDQPFLLNFMIRDTVGKLVVRPSAGEGRLEYISLGNGSGRCFLACHGYSHEPADYGRNIPGRIPGSFPLPRPLPPGFGGRRR